MGNGLSGNASSPTITYGTAFCLSGSGLGESTESSDFSQCSRKEERANIPPSLTRPLNPTST
jgi:hypothetical protein